MTQIPNQTLLNMEFFKRINIWEIQKTSERAEKKKKSNTEYVTEFWIKNEREKLNTLFTICCTRKQ